MTMRQDFISGGRGMHRLILGAQPAAQANFSVIPSTDKISRLINIRFTFTTDVNAADRILHVEAFDTPYQYHDNYSTKIITANKSWSYHWGTNLAYTDFSVGASIIQNPLQNDFFILPGDALRIVITAAEAGDQLANIRFLLEEFYI